MVNKAILTVIRAYQICISPFLRPSCRFYPSCSAYAYQAFEKHGLVNAFILTIKRIFRCHPFNPGGYDPVP